MNIVKLTPGTGNFHCGSCLRDHAFVKALKRQGHDVLIVPMYLPHVTDGDDEDHPIFFGGINVFLQHKIPFFRKTPRWIDRLFDRRGLLNMAAAKAGMTKPRELGELTLSMLHGENGKQLKELDRLITWLQELEKKPDVVVLSNCLLIGMARRIREKLGVPVVCTLQGEDTFLDDLPEPYREHCWTELRARALDVSAFIAVSEYYASVMRPRIGQEIQVVHNGLDFSEVTLRDEDWPTTPRIGFLARMCHVKGLGHLVDAFITMFEAEKARGHDCREVELCIVGACTPADEAFVAEQKEKLRQADLLDQVQFHPNVTAEEKFDFLRSFSLLCVPAMYGESFGLYVIEAMAVGTPVIQPNHAAFPEIVDLTGGGAVVEFETLAETLAKHIHDPLQLKAWGEAGRKGVETHFAIDTVARRYADILGGLDDIPSGT